MKETKIMDILDKHNISWSWMGGCVFVGNDRYSKIIEIADELLNVKTCKQGFDNDNNFIAFARDKDETSKG